jgi:glycosyltransferase involved in cell wall biosynthesis
VDSCLPHGDRGRLVIRRGRPPAKSDRGALSPTRVDVAPEHPIRVLFIATHPTQYQAPLLRRYARDPRIDITVAYCSLRGAEPSFDIDFARNVAWDLPLLDGYEWVRVRNLMSFTRRGGFWSLFNPGLIHLIRGGGWEVIVCMGHRSVSALIAALVARLSGIPMLFFTDAVTLSPLKGLRWKTKFKPILIRSLYSWAGGAACASSRAVALMREIGLPKDRIFLLPYVSDFYHFAEASRGIDAAKIRNAWGVPPARTIALFCGKLVWWKRLDDLFDAAARIPNLHLVLAGDGPLRAQHAARAERDDLRGRVTFLGFVNQSELPAVYAAADLLVLCSEYEPFGVVVHEAFSCGRPAIVTAACGAADDLVLDGETGYVVPVGSVATLADRIDRLARSTELRQAMGLRARLQAEKWSPEWNAELFAAACQSMAKQRRPVRGT